MRSGYPLVLFLVTSCSFDGSAATDSAADGDSVDSGDDSSGDDAPGDDAPGDSTQPDAPMASCLASWTFQASNHDPCAEGPVLPPLVLEAGTYVFVPATGELTGMGSPMVLPTSGVGPRILSLAGFQMRDNAMLVIRGEEPLIISVHGSAMIAGTIDASALGQQAGPGGSTCQAEAGGDALAPPATVSNWSAGGGGAGGGFGSSGGAGGRGDTENNTPMTPGGAAMLAAQDVTLTPLRGGCSGGRGGNKDPQAMSLGTPGDGGGGGGALQITVRDQLDLGGVARLAANGGGGGRGQNGVYTDQTGGHVGVGGGGGGSGGGILVEGGEVTIGASVFLCANGGGGGGGTHNNDGPITDGAPGTCSSTVALGGDGSNGDGGNGAVGSNAGAPGIDGTKQDDGGGGGGGAVGRIRIRAVSGPAPSGFGSSPTAAVN